MRPARRVSAARRGIKTRRPDFAGRRKSVVTLLTVVTENRVENRGLERRLAAARTIDGI